MLLCYTKDRFWEVCYQRNVWQCVLGLLKRSKTLPKSTPALVQSYHKAEIANMLIIFFDVVSKAVSNVYLK